jgi:hypothetical protein
MMDNVNIIKDVVTSDDQSLSPGDRHVYRNVRDVVVNGSETTCLNCHKIHGQSTEKHRRVLREAIRLDCHSAEGPRKVVKPYTVHSPLGAGFGSFTYGSWPKLNRRQASILSSVIPSYCDLFSPGPSN